MKISLDDVFSGYIERSQECLRECISCCVNWKSTFDHLTRVYGKVSGNSWVLDHTNIFAQVDAFIQRCKDLIEVTEGQSHFARKSEGKQKPMPPFAGVTGPAVSKSLKEIEATFEKHLSSLKSIKHSILDVKATFWHDSYSKYRAGVKDMEVMMQNSISSAFQTVTTVQEGVEVLEYFVPLESREVRI